MKTHQSDVIIHTRMSLNETEFNAIADIINSIDGIIRFEQSERRPNFIMVVYNASKIKALSILNQMTRLGFNASIVDM